MGRGRPKKVKQPEVNPKDGVNTKEDLIIYIEQVEGLPFLEKLWDKSVELAKKNEGKEQPMIEEIVTDKDGNQTVKRKVGGCLITNPISYYFKMYKMPQYMKEAMRIQDEIDYMNNAKSDMMETYFDDDNQEEFNEIINWINMFPDGKERQYLKQKYVSYYDNYEINDGADRVSLSRILSLEIELYRINIKRALGKSVDIVQEEKLTKMLRETLESMKWTKKQRSASDEMQNNKFTVWMDKQVKNGGFKPEHHEIPKDEIDMLIEIIPKAVAKMFD